MTKASTQARVAAPGSSRATPSADASPPSVWNSRSAGPRSAAPPTMGLTATTGAGAPRSASAMPGTARMAPMLRNGLDGATTIRSALAIAASTSGVARGRLGAPVAHRGHGVRVVAVDEVLLELEPAVRGQELGPDRSSVIGSSRAVDAQRRRQAARSRPSAGRPPAAARCATGWCPGRGRPAGTRSARRRRASIAALDQVSSRTPQPVVSLASPARVYSTVSRSGDTDSPCSSRSSPVLTTMDSSSPARRAPPRPAEASARPWLSLAPPNPPARTVTRGVRPPSSSVGHGQWWTVTERGRMRNEMRASPRNPASRLCSSSPRSYRRASATMSSSAACPSWSRSATPRMAT